MNLTPTFVDTINYSLTQKIPPSNKQTKHNNINCNPTPENPFPFSRVISKQTQPLLSISLPQIINDVSKLLAEISALVGRPDLIDSMRCIELPT